MDINEILFGGMKETRNCPPLKVSASIANVVQDKQSLRLRSIGKSQNFFLTKSKNVHRTAVLRCDNERFSK
jgi:hypothetical protein